MFIVGVTGPIGHGKSTFANLLSQSAAQPVQFESGVLIMEVANAWQAATPTLPVPTIEGLNQWIGFLPDILQTIVHVEADSSLLTFNSADKVQDPAMFDKLFQYAQLINAQPGMLKQEIKTDSKELFRPLLQWLGGYLVKMIDPGIWYDEIVRRLHQASADGHDLAIVSGLRFPGDAERIMAAHGVVMQIIRPAAISRDETDPTEREQLTVPYQVTVYNDASLADLATVAATVYQDLVQNQLKTEYHALSPSVTA